MTYWATILHVDEVSPLPAPRVTGSWIVTRACAACGALATATPPACPPASNTGGRRRASLRGRAVRIREQTFVPPRAAASAPGRVVHVDEMAAAPPAVWNMCRATTRYLTALHTGGRSKADIDAGASRPAMATRLSATATRAMPI